MAPEFYDNLPNHTSWVKVLVDFITFPDMGPSSRIKRKSKFNKEFALLNDKHVGYNKNYNKNENGHSKGNLAAAHEE
jgi:hypothetical protein